MKGRKFYFESLAERAEVEIRPLEIERVSEKGKLMVAEYLKSYITAAKAHKSVAEVSPIEIEIEKALEKGKLIVAEYLKSHITAAKVHRTA